MATRARPAPQPAPRVAPARRVAIGQPGDRAEREAEHTAAAVMRGRRVAPPGAGAGLLQRECAACEASTAEDSAPAGTMDTIRRMRGQGAPLPGALRRDLEPRFGADFSGVRVHTGGHAAAAARDLDARAFTLGSDVFFGAQQFDPAREDGRHLLAHELTHVLQNDGAVHRQTTTGGPAATADRNAEGAGPCAVSASSLSNVGLLHQLNRARLYLSQHARGEGSYYDHANLLRRLGAERQRRIAGGQVWLATHGLLDPPATLIAVQPAGPLQIAVSQLSGTVAGGAYVASVATVVTEAQFARFLSSRGIATVDAQTLQAGPQTVGLPPEVRGTVSYSLASPTVADPLADVFSGLRPPLFVSPPPLFNAGPGSAEPFAPSVPIIAGAAEQVGDLRRSPGLVTERGPERVYFPRSPDRGPTVMVYDPAAGVAGTGPSGVGALGTSVRPGWGLPAGSTGFMWEGSHVTDLALGSGGMSARGFRASLPLHTESSFRGPTSGATTRLNVGVAGSYANDALFPYLGALPSPEHWARGGGGAMAIMTAEGRPASADALIRLMAAATVANEGGTYRFSTPPTMRSDGTTPSAAYANASELAQAEGVANWCTLGGRNCINQVAGLHEAAANGLPLRYTRPDGTVVELVLPENASARNMSEFMRTVPDEVLEAHGLRRVDLGRLAWGRVGVAGSMGAGMSLAGDAWRASQGEHVGGWQVAGDAAVGGTGSAVSMVAEDWAANGLTNRLVTAGVAPAGAGVFGRAAASGGVAIVVAPITTSLQMAFSDEHYTYIDYAARSTRSGVAAAGGGALSAGVVGAIWGSEVPLAGNALGFVIGFGGYYLIDWAAGDSVEEGVREALGEPGCSGGAAP